MTTPKQSALHAELFGATEEEKPASGATPKRSQHDQELFDGLRMRVAASEALLGAMSGDPAVVALRKAQGILTEMEILLMVIQLCEIFDEKFADTNELSDEHRQGFNGAMNAVKAGVLMGLHTAAPAWAAEQAKKEGGQT